MTEGEEFFEEFEGVFDFVLGGFGADVFCAVFFNLADDLDSGKGFFGDADVDEVFVVFHDDIVLRLELFDEVVFEDDGFEFAVGFDYFDVADVFDEFAGAGGMGVVGFEVLADAFGEFFGFADVNDAAFGVEHFVNAGGLGNCLEDFV